MNTPQKYVLVVEDNPMNAKLARMILEKAQYRVDVAENVPDALKRIDSDPPDLILLDIQLPHISGIVLAETMKTRTASQKIPIIAVTALAMPGDEEKIFKAGCDAYVAKPYDRNMLLDAVRKFA